MKKRNAKGKAAKSKPAAKSRINARPASSEKWLRVCPNCGWLARGHDPFMNVNAIRCPICFFHGPAIEVRAGHYREMKFAHQKIPEKDEGRLVWPEILLMLVISALAVLIIWKLARGAF